jgi:hypothetical protein
MSHSNRLDLRRFAHSTAHVRFDEFEREDSDPSDESIVSEYLQEFDMAFSYLDGSAFCAKRSAKSFPGFGMIMFFYIMRRFLTTVFRWFTHAGS